MLQKNPTNNQDQFPIAICLSSLTDIGMKIQSIGFNCQRLFPPEFLNMVANYVALFSEQSEGEHLFGPLPVPKATLSLLKIPNSIKIDSTDLYLMIYSFVLRDLSVQDTRVQERGNVLAAQFLIFYFRKFDHIIMQIKDEFKKTFWNTLGIIKNLEVLDSDQLSLLEQTLQQLTVEQAKKGSSKSRLDYTRVPFELYQQQLRIREQIDSLLSLTPKYLSGSKLSLKRLIHRISTESGSSSQSIGI